MTILSSVPEPTKNRLVYYVLFQMSSIEGKHANKTDFF